jgi:hypothetical protein
MLNLLMKPFHITILSISFIFFTITTFGQFKLGPKFSAYSSGIKMKSMLNDKLQLSGLDQNDSYSDVNFSYGIFARYDINKIFLKADVLHCSYSARLPISTTRDNFFEGDRIVGSSEIPVNVKRLEVPLNVGIKLGVFRIQAGLVPAYLLQAKTKYNFYKIQDTDTGDVYSAKGEVDEKEFYNKVHLDAEASIGFTIVKRIFLDVKYQTNLSNIRPDIDVLGQKINAKQKLTSIGVSLAVNVLK